jgi:O-antigen ligase
MIFLSYTLAQMEKNISDSHIFDWVRHLDEVVLFLFVCCANFLHGYGQLRIIAIAMIGLFFLIHLPNLSFVLQRTIPPPPELLCYTTWVAWAIFTGYAVAIDHNSFWNSSKVTLQMLVMVWIIYTILQTRQTVNVVLLAIVAGGLIQIAAVGLGQTDLMAAVAAERQMGLVTNPNSLGFHMIWCVLCSLMFWQVQGRWRILFRAGILALIPVAGFVMLGSGSRKSSLAFVFALLCWTAYASSAVQGMRAYLVQIFAVSILLGILAVIMPFVLDNTIVGKRFERFFYKGQGKIFEAVKAQDRYDMYVEGTKILLENPLFGVGLDNFKAHSLFKNYSHSDYIEPLTNTGLIGFLLYQSFYAFLLFRSFALLRRVKDAEIIYRLKMIIISVLTIMIIGLGVPHYTSQLVFALLTTFSVYTWQIQRSFINSTAESRRNW